VKLVYTGSVSAAGRTIDAVAALGRPVANLVRPNLWVETNGMLDAISPLGRRVHTRGGYLSELTDEAISIATRHAINAPAPTSPAPSTVQNFWCTGGAISEDFDVSSCQVSAPPRSQGEMGSSQPASI